MDGIRTEPVEELQKLKGYDFFTHLHFFQILITTPPGDSKSAPMHKFVSWSEEGHFDLTLLKRRKVQFPPLPPRKVQPGGICAGHPRGVMVYNRNGVDRGPRRLVASTD